LLLNLANKTKQGCAYVKALRGNISSLIIPNYIINTIFAALKQGKRAGTRIETLLKKRSVKAIFIKK
jgi:hypothetical protein